MNKKLKKIVLLVLILFISIGFAVLTANLNLTTNLSFRENTWDVHFENAEVMYSSTALNNSVTLDTNNKTSISFETTLVKPSDYIDFSFYVVNNGTIDAQLNSITTTLTTEQQEYITYNITYDLDNTAVANNDYLYRGQSRKINVHFEYKYDVDNFYSGEAISPTITFKYIQPQSSNTTVWNYEYSGTEQYFIVPKTGTYKLETWGAQGGTINETSRGGYGGYSTGQINLNKNDKLFINVGGQGEYRVLTEDNKIALGGYNGGGSGSSGYAQRQVCGGGGATHIATASGVLSSLESNKNSILIVSGGGAGSWNWLSSSYAKESGSGGGYIGNNGKNSSNKIAYGGTQSPTEISSSENNLGGFGVGSYRFIAGHAGAGGGYYGGNSVQFAAAGGSGYIGNISLTEKIMYCYNCQESTEEADETNIKTRSTTNVSSTPTSNYAKMGNGFAKITFIG